MVRGLDYHLTGEEFPFDFEDFVRNVPENQIVGTPKRGVFDKIRIDSNSSPERKFAVGADNDDDVILSLIHI